jgi:hypothetical protein
VERRITNNRLMVAIIEAERAQQDFLSELPVELLVQNILALLDIDQIISYCNTGRGQALICEDIRFWQIYTRDMCL